MLSERQEKILLSLKRFDYLTVKQFQALHNLKSDRNAYRVINQLKAYMNVFKDEGINVYYLNKTGREIVNSDKVRKKLTSANHYIMRNDLYISLSKPTNWQNEIRIRSGEGSKRVVIVADAIYKTNRYHLIEIDHTQTMKKNKAKIVKYRALIERNAFRGMPRLIWVTTTNYRREQLLELCDGLDCQIYLKEDLH